MREAVLKVLPTEAFVLLKQDVVIKRLGGFENYIKECTESSCIVNLGKLAQVDYVSQASVGRLGNKLRLKVELYNVYTEGLVSILNDEKANNIEDLLAIVEKRVSAEVFGKIPGAVSLVNSEKIEDTVPILNPVVKEPIKTSFWAAIGLDVLGAVLLYMGYSKDGEMLDAHDKYKGVDGNFGDSWDKVESSRSSRNMFYIIGGVALASGIGVHIWF